MYQPKCSEGAASKRAVEIHRRKDVRRLANLAVVSAVVSAIVTACISVPGQAQPSGQPGPGQRRGAPTAEANIQSPARPGATWDSLAALPDLLNATWIPQDTPGDEVALLASMPLPPLKPEYLAAARQQIAGLATGETKSPAADCRWEGQPRLAWYPYPLQFMYGAGHVMIEANRIVRSIETKGLTHPARLFDPEALQSFSIYGDAAGEWQGDTLVVDTVKLREDRETFYGAPHDPDIHIVERYRLLDPDTLERVTTITSPLTMTEPWTTRTLYSRAAAGTLASKFCLLPGEPVT